MRKRHTAPLPRLWLMTDERMGDQLLPALQRLPKGSGVIFRHHSLGTTERKALFAQVKRIARARRLTLLTSRRQHHRRRGAVTAPVHSRTERIRAERNGAQLLFVSPLFATRSHPGRRPLGRVRFGLLIEGARTPIVALGGMNQRRARSLAPFRIHGWAAIDALS